VTGFQILVTVTGGYKSTEVYIGCHTNKQGVWGMGHDIKDIRSTTRTHYEWDIETFDPATGDIEDHNHDDKCPGIPSDHDKRLVLVRDFYAVVVKGGKVIDADLTDRQWAYVKGGKLPELFDDTRIKVPLRFHKELRKLA